MDTCGSTARMGDGPDLSFPLVPALLLHGPVLGLTPREPFLIRLQRGVHARTVALHPASKTHRHRHRARPGIRIAASAPTTPTAVGGIPLRRLRVPCKTRARPRRAPPLSRRPRPLFLACWRCSVCSARFCMVPSRPSLRVAPRPSPQSRGNHRPKAVVPSAPPLPRAAPPLGAALWTALGPRLSSPASSSSP